MKNKLFNKFLSVLLASFIVLTSISSFNHVSAAEFDSSYNKQLVSSGSNVHRTPFMPPTVPGGGNPLTKWIGTLSSLGFVLGIVCGVNVGNTVKVLENGFADQKTSTTFNNIINNSPNFSIEDFANDPDNLSGNYQGLYNKYGSKLNVNSYTLEDLENYNKNLYYNGGNKNYYTNNNYSSNSNYSVFNSSTNNINYTYNNQHYNYTVNNMFYNYVTNQYTYNIANNQTISISNTYNNTTIISPSGATQKLYYELPDGSNSLNLTEEQAKKGFKTSLNVASYSNGYDDDNLNFLFHFDGNEYDSAYPIVNYNLKAIPNSVDYIDSSNPSFNQSIAFSDSFDLSVEGSNYNNYYSFRIFPHISDNWSLKINGIDIGTVTSKYDSTSNYEEYDSLSEAPSTKLYIVPMKDNYYLYYSRSNGYDRYFIIHSSSGVLHPSDFNFSDIFSISPTARPSSDSSSLLGTSKSIVSSWAKSDLGYYPDFITFYRSGSDLPLYVDGKFDSYWTLQKFVDEGYFGEHSSVSGVLPYGGMKTLMYQNYSSVAVSNFRQYNFINNKTFLQTGTNLLNYNQWNFISIDTSGKVFINGVDTNIIVPLDRFKISVTGDSLTYIDELASFKTNRSNISPSIPYDSNVSYYLPPVYYEDVYTPSQTFKDGYYTVLNGIQSSSISNIYINELFHNLYFKCNLYFHPQSRYFPILKTSYFFKNLLYCDFLSDLSSFYIYSKTSSTFKSNYSSKLNSNIIFNFISNSSYLELNGDRVVSDSFISEPFTMNNFYITLNPNYSLSSFTYFSNVYKKDVTFYSVVSKEGSIGFYSPVIDIFLTTGNLVSDGVKYNVQNVKKSEIKNNMLLIQSLTSINSSKFGGIRPSNPSTGDVYCSVNENGNITSVQQYNGIEWVKVVGSIYNDALGLWVNAVGFNIFLDNWSYQDIDYRADNPDTNILIRFLTSQFNKVTSLLDSIVEKIKGVSSDQNIINNYQNNYNVDINTNIDNLINTSKDYDKDIDLNSPSYNVDDSILTDINNLAVGSKGIFKALDDSGFSILYLAPLILLLVGLLL